MNDKQHCSHCSLGKSRIIGAVRPLPKDYEPNEHFVRAAEKIKELKRRWAR